jgi:hypothetical protein
MGLSRNTGVGTGHWRPATCKLSEEGDQCLLNIYVDVGALRPYTMDSTKFSPGDDSVPNHLHTSTEPFRYSTGRHLIIFSKGLSWNLLCYVRIHLS